MRQFTLTDIISTPMLLLLLSFLVRRLTGRTEAKEIYTRLRGIKDRLKAEIAIQDDLEEARACATAELGALDADLDDAVAEFASHVIAYVRKDRAHPVYQHLFPIAPSAGTKDVASADQAAFVSAMLSAYAEEKSIHHLEPYVEVIRIAHAAIEAERAVRDSLNAELMKENGRMLALRTEAIGAYNDAFHALSLVYPGRKARVQSYYYNKRSVTKAPAE